MPIKRYLITDDFWLIIEQFIPKPVRPVGVSYKRREGGGRKQLSQRKVLGRILFVLRTGSRWDDLPKTKGMKPKSIHAYFKRWLNSGVFDAVWHAGLAEWDEMKGIAWVWDATLLGGSWRPAVAVRIRSKA